MITLTKDELAQIQVLRAQLEDAEDVPEEAWPLLERCAHYVIEQCDLNASLVANPREGVAKPKMVTKAQIQRKTRELQETRELSELTQTLDFKKLTDAELTELLGIRNKKAGKPATPKRSLEILRGAKERIESRAAMRLLRGEVEEVPAPRVATGRKLQRDG